MDLKDRLDKAYSGKKPGSGGPERSPSAEPPSPPRPAPGPSRLSDAADKEGLLKKTAAERSFRKVAKFLLLLGKEEAARVMKHLKSEELEGIVREMATIGPIERVEAEAILKEFDEVRAAGASLEGGEGAARGILVRAFGEEGGERILKRAVPGSGRPFSFLGALDATQLLLLLKDESSQVMSIVLPHLDPRLASAFLMKLEGPRRSELIRRMAKLEKIAPEVLSSVEEGLRRAAAKLERVDTEEIDGASALAGILRHVDPDLEEDILDDLDGLDPALSDSIRDRLFTLDDVVRVPQRELSAELRPMEDKDIALLLKGKGISFREKILSCLSRERRAMVEDECEILGSVRKQDADQAARSFLIRLKALHEDGSIVLEGEEDLVD